VAEINYNFLDNVYFNVITQHPSRTLCVYHGRNISFAESLKMQSRKTSDQNGWMETAGTATYAVILGVSTKQDEQKHGCLHGTKQHNH